MIDILQDRDKKLDLRVGLVLAIAHDLQVRIKREDIFSIDDVFEKYQTEKAVQFVEAKLSEDENYAFVKKMFRNQYLMERLRDDWEPHLLEAESLLYGDIGCSDSEEQCTKYKDCLLYTSSLIALSTCSEAETNGRVVLIGKLEREVAEKQ